MYYQENSIEDCALILGIAEEEWASGWGADLELGNVRARVAPRFLPLAGDEAE